MWYFYEEDNSLKVAYITFFFFFFCQTTVFLICYLFCPFSSVGMATCCICSLQDLLPPLGRWWTRPPRTHLHHYHPSHLLHLLLLLLHPLWSLGPTQHPRSRRMRLISIWPSKMAKSTGTKTHSCKKQAHCKHSDQTVNTKSDTWWVFVFISFTDVAIVPLENVCTVYH